jgi:dynein heavy chain
LNDLVSKDLIEKFHSFLSHTYVTIGNVKGRTMLPLPPMESPAQERQSSKEKAAILETALMHWTK